MHDTETALLLLQIRNDTWCSDFKARSSRLGNMYVPGAEFRLLDNFKPSSYLYLCPPCLSQTWASPGSKLVCTIAALSALHPLSISAAAPVRQGTAAQIAHPANHQQVLQMALLLGSGKSSLSTCVQSFPWCLTLDPNSRKLSQGQISMYQQPKCDQLPDFKSLLEDMKELVNELVRIICLLFLAFAWAYSWKQFKCISFKKKVS